ncbi:MAG: polysaccharide biosynthesis C-terminal domain-containing protein, partial [Blautia sp.]|nr:polysaccharide biosynthesis C-terminal domain-containing protein [Blautia sp.]
MRKMQKEIRRELLILAFPLMVSNILQQFYQAVDGLILARYVGANAFAASGVASALLNLLSFAIVGLCGGLSVLFARYYGAGDLRSFRRQHFHSLVCGLFLTGLLCLGTILFQGPLLLLLKTPEELREGTRLYLLLVGGALPASFLYNFYGTILRSAGKTRECLYILIASLIANAVLDYLLVVVFTLGIAGAALATALCQMLSALFAMASVWRKDRKLFFTRQESGLDGRILSQTLSFGLIGGLHQASLYIGKLFVQGAINSLGTDAILAFTAASRLEGFANSIGDSGATATSIVVAQAYGAG